MRMRDLLEKSSSTTQVIVMTCHPEQYPVAGSAANTFDLQTVIKRRRGSFLAIISTRAKTPRAGRGTGDADGIATVRTRATRQAHWRERRSAEMLRRSLGNSSMASNPNPRPTATGALPILWLRRSPRSGWTMSCVCRESHHSGRGCVCRLANQVS